MSVPRDTFALHLNSRFAPGYPPELARFVNWDRANEAYQAIAAWPGYAPTPLVRLDGLARNANVGAVLCKYEGGRFGIGSFKALGGAYAVRRAVEKSGGGSSETFATASDGNHGLSVAWGAREAGARCVVFLHRHVSAGRERLILDMGAEVIRVEGNYDDSVRAAERQALSEGWHLVPDTAPMYEEAPATVMAGYGTMVREMYQQFETSGLPTHYFIQGGCGGLAAAVCGLLRQLSPGLGDECIVVVEPEKADCLFASAQAGRRVVVEGDLDTIMSGLSVGEVSGLAWPVLERGVNGFLTISDAAAIFMMRALANGDYGDDAIEVGDSGVAGMAGLLAVARDPDTRAKLGLTEQSRVAVIATEGPVDRESFDRLLAEVAA